MEIAHYVHEPRVLTEQQEAFSTPLSPPSHKKMEEAERELSNCDFE